MKINRKPMVLTVALLLFGKIYAQQDPNYTFYQYNMNIYNPAYAGSSEAGDLIFGLWS